MRMATVAPKPDTRPAGRSNFPDCRRGATAQRRPTVRAPITASFLLALAGLFGATGCSHPTRPAAGLLPPTSPADRVLLEHATRLRLVHVYIDSATSAPGAPSAADFGPANTVAASLRELLRDRGFDVRATELVLPRGETGVVPGALVRAIAAGERPPSVSRAVTYLHPNAPRLLLFVRLDGYNEADALPVVLGAFIADSADGAILWSNRVAAATPPSDSQLRLLATQLLKSLPCLPPA